LTERAVLARLWAWEDRNEQSHTQRWHAHRHSTGSGHVYQGRFKSFPVQEDEHFYTVCRYVERNALRANLAPGAERWRWGSLHRWKLRYGEGKVVVGGLALAALAGLGRARQRTANRGGVGGAASLRATRQSVRRGSLVRPDRPPTGTGKHASPPRPPQKARKRFLTPFLPRNCRCSLEVAKGF
jgi:hypothetical protein